MQMNVTARLAEIDTLAAEINGMLSREPSPRLRAELLMDLAELIDEVVELLLHDAQALADHGVFGSSDWTPYALALRADAVRGLVSAEQARAASGERERCLNANLERVAGGLLDEIADRETDFQRRKKASEDVLGAATALTKLSRIVGEAAPAEYELMQEQEPRRRAELVEKLIGLIERLASLDGTGVVQRLRQMKLGREFYEQYVVALRAVVDAELAAVEGRPREASGAAWVEETIGDRLDQLVDPATNAAQRRVTWIQLLAALHERAEQADRTA